MKVSRAQVAEIDALIHRLDSVVRNHWHTYPVTCADLELAIAWLRRIKGEQPEQKAS